MGDDQTTNTERVYEFTCQVHSRQLVERGEMGSTAYRQILVLAVLFAGLSYAQTVLARTEPGHLSGLLEIIWWSALVVGAVAALALAYAFFIALKLLRIGQTYLPGTDFDTSRNPDWISDPPKKVLLDLTRATVKAIDRCREDENDRRARARRLNCSLKVGFPVTVLCLVAASAVDLMAPKKNNCHEHSLEALEKSYMGDETENQPTDSEGDSASSTDDDSSSLNTTPQGVTRGEDERGRESTTSFGERVHGR